MKQGRLQPSYTNIALMYGYLWAFAAVPSHRPDWANQAQWQESVYKLFKQHDSFFEYNSPTYAGADFYGLALWRDYGSTQHAQYGQRNGGRPVGRDRGPLQRQPTQYFRAL